jgi:hypothetical protein
MKKKSIELNVDFIGGQGPLTKEEELIISEFIRKSKEKRKLKIQRRKIRRRTKTHQPT